MLKLVMVIAMGAVACGDENVLPLVEPAASKPAAPPAKQPTAAKPGFQETPKPPSTGNELPATAAPSVARAKELVAKAVVRAKQPDPPCEQIADELTEAVPIAFPELVKDAIPGLGTWFACATKARRWRAVVHAGRLLLELGYTDEKVPSGIVRALAEMGEYDKAIAIAQDYVKSLPRSRSMVMAALSMVYCRAEAWERCVATADAVLAELGRMKVDPASDSVTITRLFRDLGWIVTGKPKQALADIAIVEKARGPIRQLAQAKAAASSALERGYYLDVVPVPQLPLGVYHLMGRAETGALVTFKLREQMNKARKFRIEVEVPGITERSSNTLALAAGAHQVNWANPPLKIDLDVSKIRGPRPSQLHVRIVELAKSGDQVVIDETVPLEVLPRDYLPLKRKVGADSLVPTYGFLGAWVTPNDKAIDGFLTKAKQRAPGRNFVGEQDATVPQVKALFDELKARGVTYVMDPDVTAERVFVQRTRLPAEVLASTNAQCLESTLLFATLLESIGIRPMVVLVPGHAFVGWQTVPKDGSNGEPLFLETTMIGGASFEDALAVATRRARQESRSGSFKSGAATVVDIAKIRAGGFIAQPL